MTNYLVKNSKNDKGRKYTTKFAYEAAEKAKADGYPPNPKWISDYSKTRGYDVIDLDWKFQK